MKIVKLCMKVREDKKPSVFIRKSDDLHDVFRKHFDKDTLHLSESFWVCYMTANHEVVGMYNLSNGGITATVADVRLIIAGGLQLGAVCVAIAHNHPSGNKSFSQSDIRVTEQVSMACGLLEMKLLDHIVLAGDSYASMQDEGLLSSYNATKAIEEIKRASY